MSLDIQIKIDPSQAVASAGQITTAVDKTVQAGVAAGKTISAGMMAAAEATQRAKDGALTYKDGLDLLGHVGSGRGLAAQFEREAAMLEKIQGPLREYTNNLAALDALMSKDMITTQQYADQVIRLNQALARHDSSIAVTAPQHYGPAFDPALAGVGGGGGGGAGGPGLSELASGLQSVTGGAGVAGQMLSQFGGTTGIAAAASLALAGALVHVGDAYLELTNRVRRFADAQHSAAAIVDDELAMAGGLHASLAQTANLYETVRASTDDLNLTYQQSANLTQNLGEAAVLSGKGIDAAAAAAEKLAYWQESGMLTSRELKSTMREFPALADLWTTSTGRSRASLLAMAADGRLSVQQLISPLEETSKVLDGGMAKHAQTASEAWQHLKDQVTISLGKFVESTGVIPHLADSLEHLAGTLKSVEGAFQSVGTAMSWYEKVKDVVSYVDPTEQIKKLGSAAYDGFRGAQAGTQHEDGFIVHMFDEIQGKELNAEKALGNFQTSILNLQTRLMLLDPAAGGVMNFFIALQHEAQAAQNQVTTLSGALGVLRDRSLMGMAPTTFANAGARAQADDEAITVSRKLEDAKLNLTKITASYGGVVEEVTKKDLTHQRTLQDTKAAFSAGAISARQYGDEMTRLADEDLARWQSEVTHAVKAVTESMVMGRTSMADYDRSMSKIDASAGPFSTQAKILTELRAPVAEAQHGLSVLNGLYADGTVNLAEYTRAAEQLYAKMPGFTEAQKLITEQLLAYQGPKKPKGLTQDERDQQKADSITAFRARWDDAHMEPAERYKSALRGLSDDLKENLIDQDRYDKKLEKLQETFTTIRTPAEQYALALKHLKDEFATGLPSAAAQAQALADLRDKYNTLKTPAEEFASAARKIDQEFSAGLSSVAGYELAMRKLREQYGAGTFADGMADGLKQIRQEMSNLADVAKTELVGAFHAVETSIENALSTGKFDKAALISSLRQVASHALVKGAEGALSSALGIGGPDGGAALTGAATALDGSAVTLQAAGAVLTGAAEVLASSLGLGGGSGGGGFGGLLSLFNSGGAGDAAAASGSAAGASDGLPALADVATVAAYHRPGQDYAGGATQNRGSVRDGAAPQPPVIHNHIHMDPKELLAALQPGIEQIANHVVVKHAATGGPLSNRRR